MKIIYSLMSIALLAGCATEPASQQPTQPEANATKKEGVANASAEATVLILPHQEPLPKTVEKVTAIDLDAGDPKSITITTRTPILIRYDGWIYDPSKPDGKGAQFENSRDQMVPKGFIVGAGRVIKGWDIGVVGMKAKGKRTLIIPSAYAYGEKGTEKVPPNSTLLFEIEIIQILGAPAAKPR